MDVWNVEQVKIQIDDIDEVVTSIILPNKLKGLADSVVAIEHQVHGSGNIRDVDGANLGATAVNADRETARHYHDSTKGTYQYAFHARGRRRTGFWSK